MNGLLDNQASGNDWGVPIQAMLHERIQTTRSQSSMTSVQSSFIQGVEEQMRQFESDFQRAVLDLRKFYVFPADNSVVDFLNDHRVLPQLLVDAALQLRKYFTDTVFTLRASSDEYGWQNLYVDAMWNGDARDAIRLLDRFEDEWWIPNCRAARGALTFTYRLS